MFFFRRLNIASHHSLESSLKGIQSPPTMFRTAKFLLSPSAYRWSKTQLQYVTNILHHDNHNSFFFGHNIDIHQVSNMLSVKVTFDRWTKKTTSSVAFLLKESCHFIGRQGCLLQIHSWERCFFKPVKPTHHGDVGWGTQICNLCFAFCGEFVVSIDMPQRTATHVCS